MAESNQIRIGAADVELDAVGGTFATATDLGKTHTDGVTVTFEDAQVEIGSAQDITINEIFDIGPQRLSIEFSVKEHKMTHFALSIGQATDDVTDNSSDTPKNKQVDLGGWKAPQYYALRLKVPQPESPTLYDVLVLYKAKFVAAYQQAFTYRGERYIPLKAVCVTDPDNSDQYGYMQLEYTV